MDDETRRGLDEVRRLLYTAKFTYEDDHAPSYELIGTIHNAVTHHHRDLGLVPMPTRLAPRLAWCTDAIETITALLGDG